MIDLSKKQVSESDQVADKVVWLQQSATTTWTEVILHKFKSIQLHHKEVCRFYF